MDCGNGSPVIRNCVFINNKGGIGGGVAAEGAALIEDCVFINNSVKHTEYGGHGGGIAVLGSGDAQVKNCTFYSCSSENKGGGAFLDKGSSASFIHCTFSGNAAPDGSGFCLVDAGTVSMANSIIAFNGPGAAVSGTGTMDLFHSNVFGNAGGDWAGPIQGQEGSNGNLSLDPLFVDGDKGDLHLQYGSPCREAGDNTFPGLPDHDLEGDPRPAMGSVDMGADEFHIHLYAVGEGAPNSKMELKVIEKPEKEVHLWVGTEVWDSPLTTLFGPWHLKSFLPPLLLGNTSWKGSVEWMTRIPPDYPVPSTLYLQSLVRDQLTNLCVVEIR